MSVLHNTVTGHPEPTLIVPFNNVFILPRDYFEVVGQDYFHAHPVGFCPWKFVDHIPETSFTMEANTDYWGKVPAYKYVIDYQIPKEATQMAMFGLGEIDIAPDLSNDMVIQLQDEGWPTVEVGLPILASISFQGTWFINASPLRDTRVRQAMSYAIDRQSICNTYYGGNAVPGGQWYMHTGCWGWINQLAADTYDPNKARAMLAEAAYPSGFSNIHIYYNNSSWLTLLEVLRDYWAAVGIRVEIELVSNEVFMSYIFDSDGMTESDPNVGWIFPWIFESTFNSLYHARNMYCSGGMHNTGHDTTADDLYDKAIKEPDPALARQYWEEFQTYARGMYVNVGICQIKPLKVYNHHSIKFMFNTFLNIYAALADIQHID